MKIILMIEEIALFFLSLYFYSLLQMPWWLFVVLLFVPDISMVAYIFGNKIGAIVYNVFHFRGLAIFFYMLGVMFSLPSMSLAGIVLLAHSTLDRIFGFGLKYYDSFTHTHLQTVVKGNKA